MIATSAMVVAVAIVAHAAYLLIKRWKLDVPKDERGRPCHGAARGSLSVSIEDLPHVCAPNRAVSPLKTVQGDLGWSSFEAREATSKVSYDGRLRLMDRCRWAKRLFVYTHMTSLQSRWRKRLYQLEKKFCFFTEPVEATTEKEWESVVRKRVREQENVQWLELEAARTKSTLTMYAELKQQITAETRLYDNSLGSRLLFEARAGALRTLVYKQRFDNSVQLTVCRVCEGESETAEHIILHCGGIRPSATSPTEEANRLHEGGLPLATELGFSTSERSNTTQAFWKTIEQTKRRLEDWWHHTQHRVR
ncbi:hypothetical protein HPB47_011244 [Ixodes persulcatus]|uniref:Uncharacterized protein n=1 Tax=Ixodes persulcatus TaxID=34615 RepID=A0AC60NWU2_IXOPE|nr:hypothetical protein HPB47_011244 [Ixodes persulcatus]